MRFRHIIFQTLIFLANVALVFLVAWALGFDILATASGKRIYIYLGIALGFTMLEYFIFEKIKGNA